jgi:hypothetical protein
MRTHEVAELYGVASWNPKEWEVQEFRVQSLKVSSTKTPEQAMNELRALVGRYFDGVDAENYVSSIRDEAEDI